jgi:tRNA 2-thiouridine synthesizing protein A
MQAATTLSNTEFKADKSLDCSGDLCPLPVYKASKSLARLDRGQILELRCTDPGSVRDIPALANQGGHELVATDQSEPGVHLFWLRKGGAS